MTFTKINKKDIPLNVEIETRGSKIENIDISFYKKGDIIATLKNKNNKKIVNNLNYWKVI